MSNRTRKDLWCCGGLIRQVRRVKLSPGEVIIVQVGPYPDGKLVPMSVAKKCRDVFKKVLPGTPVVLVTLPIELTVVPKESIPA